MSINTTSTGNGLANVASQLFTQVDGNKDGKLSSAEFQSFLENLLTKVGTSGTSGLGTAATAIAATPAATPKAYQGMLGFDYVKLNTPSHTTPKYVFARATQDVELGWDRPSRSAGLEKIATYMKEHGYPNAKVTGDDTMDMGDGYGNIDVLTGDGQWWWGPKGNA